MKADSGAAKRLKDLKNRILKVYKFAQKNSEHFKSDAELELVYNHISFLHDNVHRPLLIVVMGEFKSGKSTFINALLTKNLLKTDVTPATAVVTVLSNGLLPRIYINKKGGMRQRIPVQMLSDITAEGNSEYASLRNQINFVDVKCRSRLLKYFNIIDTPGLNSIHDNHTDATNSFIKNSDAVFWLFDYNKVGTKTELAALDSMPEDLKKFAVINRIDEHDPDEDGDLEEIVDGFRKRIGGRVDKVIILSAKKALYGMLKRKKGLIKESHIEAVLDVLYADLAPNGIDIKARRIESRFQELNELILKKHNSLRQQLQEIKSAENTLSALRQLKQFWSEIKQGEDKPLSRICDNYQMNDWMNDFPISLKNREQIIDKLDVFISYLKELFNERKKIQEISEKLIARDDDSLLNSGDSVIERAKTLQKKLYGALSESILVAEMILKNVTDTIDSFEYRSVQEIELITGQLLQKYDFNEKLLNTFK